MKSNRLARISPKNIYRRLRRGDKFFILSWVFFASVISYTALVLLLVTIISPNNNKIRYAIFAAKPQVLGIAQPAIGKDDTRALKIDKTLEKFGCPIAGYGKKFVSEADKYDIPYWVVASIAFQETSCGKNVPTKNGEYSYNLWGWGVYGTNVKMFDDYNHGIEVVSKYMSDKFYSQGTTELCEIMKTYTPPSKGSWCNGVGFFRDQILQYEDPAE